MWAKKESRGLFPGFLSLSARDMQLIFKRRLQDGGKIHTCFFCFKVKP